MIVIITMMIVVLLLMKTLLVRGDRSAMRATAVLALVLVLSVVGVRAGGAGSVALRAGQSHTCAVVQPRDSSERKGKCWGRNVYGQLGYGDAQDRGERAGEMGSGLPYVALGGGSGRSVVAIDAGGDRSCAVLSVPATGRNETMCWGRNTFGQLGYGDTNNRGDGPGEMGDALPVVALGSGLEAVAISGGALFSCARLNDSSAKCWGQNANGMLGQGDVAVRGDEPGEMGDGLAPIDVGTGRTVQQIECGDSVALALLDDGSTKAWGRNNLGQLGYGDTEQRGDELWEMGDNLSAINFGPGRSARKLAAGANHACALLDDWSTKCWGYNAFGQLGQGDTSIRGNLMHDMGENLSVVDIGSHLSAVDICAQENGACVVTNTSQVKCWGNNQFGQLGYGDIAHRGDNPGEMGDALPFVNLPLPTGAQILEIQCGSRHLCVLESVANETFCFGINWAGQLGLEDNVTRGNTPYQMGLNLSAVSVGAQVESAPTSAPSPAPTTPPTAAPSTVPTTSPSGAPTVPPTPTPSSPPSQTPTASPTAAPTAAPTAQPSVAPSAAPTMPPSAAPSLTPTLAPSANGTATPTLPPTSQPPSVPSSAPTAIPTSMPSTTPSAGPTAYPSSSPTAAPTEAPTSYIPSTSPTQTPTWSPTLTQMPTPGSSNTTNSTGDDAPADDDLTADDGDDDDNSLLFGFSSIEVVGLAAGACVVLGIVAIVAVGLCSPEDQLPADIARMKSSGSLGRGNSRSVQMTPPV